MGDRVVLMREGEIEQVGPPAEVYARPVSPYAANFLGVRDRIAVTVGAGGLEYDGGTVAGSAEVAEGWQKDEKMVLFARDQDVRISRTGSDVRQPGDLALQGTLAQVVLGSGGRRRYIVDVAGNQWYAGLAATEDLEPGEKVQVTIAAGRALIYRGEELVSK
jgi:iron(III) transport system ATP-binding protein